MKFANFSPTSFLFLGQKIGLGDILPDAYFIIPETFLLFLHLSDASNLKGLVW